MLVQNTVFISYRRTNVYTARAVYQELKKHQYDCFLDYNSIDNGSFERIILSQIRARGHFLLILTPSTLERCVSPEDWVRREIECALEHQRNIVPVMFDDFDFQKHGTPYLSGTLAKLPQYNALRIHADYFEEGIERLIKRYLSHPIDATLHPVEPVIEQNPVLEVSLDRLREAEEQFDLGKTLLAESKWKQAWKAFSAVIEITPQNADAYFQRADILHYHGKVDRALADISKSIELDPQNRRAYCLRGDCYRIKGDLIKAIADYTESLRLYPPNVNAYMGRGVARLLRDDCERAISDFQAVLKLHPNYQQASEFLQDARKRRRELTNPLAKVGAMLGVYQADYVPENALEYYERGLSHSIDDVEKRVADFTKALEIDPHFRRALIARATTYYHHSDFEKSLADDTEVLKQTPDNHLAYANRAETYLAVGDYQSALDDARKSLELKPDKAHPQAVEALALFHLGQEDQARELWLQLEEKRAIVRNIDRTAYRLSWHDNIAERAKALVDTLE